MNLNVFMSIICYVKVLGNQLIKRQSCHHTETSQLICYANHLTGFYMMATLAFNELMYVIT